MVFFANAGTGIFSALKVSSRTSDYSTVVSRRVMAADRENIFWGGRNPGQEGLAFHPRGLRSKAISTLNARDWHFEQRSRVQACFKVTFQPRMLARERGSISRSCWHWRQVTQMT